jgi:hypothetical protein
LEEKKQFYTIIVAESEQQCTLNFNTIFDIFKLSIHSTCVFSLNQHNTKGSFSSLSSRGESISQTKKKTNSLSLILETFSPAQLHAK